MFNLLENITYNMEFEKYFMSSIKIRIIKNISRLTLKFSIYYYNITLNIINN